MRTIIITLSAAVLGASVLVTGAHAQSRALAPPPTGALFLLPDLPVNTTPPARGLPLRPREESASSGPVITGAVFGGLIGGVAAALSAIGGEAPSWWVPAGFAGGAALGGMGAAALSGRRVAPVSTGIGTLIGSIPLFAVSIAGYDDGMLPALILSVAGTTVGNQAGQRAPQ